MAKNEKIKIAPASYEGGMVQSLTRVRGLGTPDECKLDGTGFVLVREQPYNFGKAVYHETIVVEDGCLQINGRWYDPGETALVTAGEQVVITARVDSRYFVRYNKPEPTE